MPRMALCLLAVGLLLRPAAGAFDRLVAQTGTPVVYVVPISGVIDLGLAPFLSRTIDEAPACCASSAVGGRP